MSRSHIVVCSISAFLCACPSTTPTADMSDAPDSSPQADMPADVGADIRKDTGPDLMDGTPRDITGAVFARRDPGCASYVGRYNSTVMDQSSQGRTLQGSLEITDAAQTCTFTTNSVPNHDFGVMMQDFASPVAAVPKTFHVPKNPAKADMPTSLTLQYDNAIFLNGAKLDLLAAACYGVGNEPLGRERIGCNQSGTPWRYDPMSPLNEFRTDDHNAHTQPDGSYHYHGDPLALYDLTGNVESGVVGFAADGFPIFGPFILEDGTVRRVRSGYKLGSQPRASQDGEGAFPGGMPDGTYIDDYVWDEANGDLDACNGMTRDGVYGYYITEQFPWVLGCFTGTPDPSFQKMMGRP